MGASVPDGETLLTHACQQVVQQSHTGNTQWFGGDHNAAAGLQSWQPGLASPGHTKCLLFCTFAACDRLWLALTERDRTRPVAVMCSLLDPSRAGCTSWLGAHAVCVSGEDMIGRVDEHSYGFFVTWLCCAISFCCSTRLTCVSAFRLPFTTFWRLSISPLSFSAFLLQYWMPASQVIST